MASDDERGRSAMDHPHLSTRVSSSSSSSYEALVEEELKTFIRWQTKHFYGEDALQARVEEALTRLAVRVAAQKDEELKGSTLHAGNFETPIGRLPFYRFPWQCEPEYDQGHWVVVWYDDLYDVMHHQAAVVSPVPEPKDGRYATDAEAKEAGRRMVEKHRGLLERLAKNDGPVAVLEAKEFYEPAEGDRIVRLYRDGSWLEDTRGGRRKHCSWPGSPVLEAPQTTNAVHTLKTWPEFFQAVVEGRKRYEVRRNDRPFQVGDCLVLQEFDPGRQQYTGEMFSVRVLYLSSAFPPADHVVMSIEPWVPEAPPKGVQHAPTCAREILRHADDSAAYLRERCTCGATPVRAAQPKET